MHIFKTMSKFLNRFAIPFVSLKEGLYEYDYEITDLFFDNFEFSEIRKGKVIAHLSLERQTSLLILNFNIKGSVIVSCDICLDELELPIECSNTLLVKFGNEYREETDEAIIIPINSNEINVAQFIYEFIHLALPIKRVHPLNDKGESTCDPLMIKRLDELKCNSSNNNPWDVLKNLNVN